MKSFITEDGMLRVGNRILEKLCAQLAPTTWKNYNLFSDKDKKVAKLSLLSLVVKNKAYYVTYLEGDVIGTLELAFDEIKKCLCECGNKEIDEEFNEFYKLIK